jgi:hypothetical protein
VRVSGHVSDGIRVPLFLVCARIFLSVLVPAGHGSVPEEDAALGVRVVVYFDDGQWYGGRISSQKSTRGKIEITFDDGDKQRIALPGSSPPVCIHFQCHLDLSWPRWCIPCRGSPRTKSEITCCDTRHEVCIAVVMYVRVQILRYV